MVNIVRPIISGASKLRKAFGAGADAFKAAAPAAEAEAAAPAAEAAAPAAEAVARGANTAETIAARQAAARAAEAARFNAQNAGAGTAAEQAAAARAAATARFEAEGAKAAAGGGGVSAAPGRGFFSLGAKPGGVFDATGKGFVNGGLRSLARFNLAAAPVIGAVKTYNETPQEREDYLNSLGIDKDSNSLLRGLGHAANFLNNTGNAASFGVAGGVGNLLAGNAYSGPSSTPTAPKPSASPISAPPGSASPISAPPGSASPLPEGSVPAVSPAAFSQRLASMGVPANQQNTPVVSAAQRDQILNAQVPAPRDTTPIPAQQALTNDQRDRVISQLRAPSPGPTPEQRAATAGNRPGQFVNLSSGDNQIYGTASTPGGRINDFTGGSGAARAPGELTDLTNTGTPTGSIAAPSTGLRGGAYSNVAAPAPTPAQNSPLAYPQRNERAVNARYDELAKKLEGFYGPKGKALYLPQQLAQLENIRSGELGRQDTNAVTARGQDIIAAGQRSRDAAYDSRTQALEGQARTSRIDADIRARQAGEKDARTATRQTDQDLTNSIKSFAPDDPNAQFGIRNNLEALPSEPGENPHVALNSAVQRYQLASRAGGSTLRDVAPADISLLDVAGQYFGGNQRAGTLNVLDAFRPGARVTLADGSTQLVSDLTPEQQNEIARTEAYNRKRAAQAGQ